MDSCKGEDLLVVLVGSDKRPVAKVMREKRTVRQLEEEYCQGTTIYLWNKNLQTLYG